jgi:hypothetical protein
VKGQDDPWDMFSDPHLDKEEVLKTAQTCYETCKELDPGDAVVRYQLGCVYQSLNRIGEARIEYETALRLAPHYAYPKQALEELEQMSTMSSLCHR